MKVLLAFSSRRPRARVLRVTAVTVTAMCVAVLVLHSGVRHPPGVQVLLGGAAVSGVSFADGHVWVAAAGAGTVSELDPDGTLVRTLSGFTGPTDVIGDGADMWVVNLDDNSGSLAEFSAVSGARIRTMTDYGLENITDAVACGPDIWVLEGPPLSGGTWLVELDAADGRLLRTVPVPSGIPDGNGVAVAVDGEDLWVANTGDTGSLTELSARDGRLVRIVSGSRYAFSPSAVTAEGGDIWVADDPSGENAGWVTEVSSASGALVRVVSGARYGFNAPAAIAAAGPDVWVANYWPQEQGGSVTEFSVASGRWVRTAVTVDPWVGRALLDDIFRTSYDFSNPDAIAVYGGRVWVGNENSVTVMPAS
jgi:hypothetical protein